MEHLFHNAGPPACSLVKLELGFGAKQEAK